MVNMVNFARALSKALLRFLRRIPAVKLLAGFSSEFIAQLEHFLRPVRIRIALLQEHQPIFPLPQRISVRSQYLEQPIDAGGLLFENLKVLFQRLQLGQHRLDFILASIDRKPLHRREELFLASLDQFGKRIGVLVLRPLLLPSFPPEVGGARVHADEARHKERSSDYAKVTTTFGRTKNLIPQLSFLQFQQYLATVGEGDQNQNRNEQARDGRLEGGVGT